MKRKAELAWMALNSPMAQPKRPRFTHLKHPSIKNDTVSPQQLVSKSPVGSPEIHSATDDLAEGNPSCIWFFNNSTERKAVMSVRDFGGIGDGKRSNTKTFRRAVSHMRGFAATGGSQLNVPKDTWLTESFNLTSNFTLFLEEGGAL